MKTIGTKEELKNALENKEKEILCVGKVAKAIRRKKKVKMAAKIGGIATFIGGTAAIVGGIAAAPFTGGVSLTGAVAGASAIAGAGAALTISTITLSTTELAIICGTCLASLAIYKHYDVVFNPNGSVSLIANNKQ